MIDIDIDELSEYELIALNREIVERLRYLERLKTHTAMLKFHPGDRVSFRDNDGREVSGVLEKYNQKTVTVRTDAGQKWNVSPGLITREAIDGNAAQRGNVLPIKRD